MAFELYLVEKASMGIFQLCLQSTESAQIIVPQKFSVKKLPCVRV